MLVLKEMGFAEQRLHLPEVGLKNIRITNPDELYALQNTGFLLS